MHNGEVNQTARRPGAPVPLLVTLPVTLLLALGGLSACGGDATDSEAGSGASSSAGAAVASESAEPSEEPAPDYLPVPDGVTLTEPGTDLELKDEAVVAWEPRQKLVGVLEVKVKSLEQTSFKKSFSEWKLDKATRQTTPYFVRAKIANLGDSDVGGREVPLYAEDANGTLIEASTFETRFEPCASDGAFPKKFGADAAQELCLVYLVPEGAELAAVTFQPVQDFDAISWTGTVKDLTAKKDKGDKEKNKNTDKKNKDKKKNQG